MQPMRWILADPQNAAEQQFKQHVLAATERWWQAFQANAANIDQGFRGNFRFDIAKFMEDYWQPIHPGLMWEFGAARTGTGHRLCVTPEAAHWLRPVLQYILSRAPKIPGWEFYGYRLPEPVEQVIAAVQGRTGIDCKGARLECRVGLARKIDLSFTFPQAKVPVEDQRGAAFVAAEALLGEETLDAWIGVIEVASPETDLRRHLSLDRAQETISSLIRSLYDQLPSEAGYVLSAETMVTSYQLQPEQAADYPRRSDILVGSTRRMDVVEAAIRHSVFDSRCHSRFNERFCYLKMDVSAIPGEARIEYRAQFEDPLAAALAQAQIGGVIGGASGIKYSYIDLGLIDVMRAIPGIQQLLASLRAPKRSCPCMFQGQNVINMEQFDAQNVLTARNYIQV